MPPLHSARLQGESPAALQCAPCASPRLASPLPPLASHSPLGSPIKRFLCRGSRHMSAFLDAEVGVPLRGLHAHRLLLSLKPLQSLLFGERQRERGERARTEKSRVWSYIGKLLRLDTDSKSDCAHDSTPSKFRVRVSSFKLKSKAETFRALSGFNARDAARKDASTYV